MKKISMIMSLLALTACAGGDGFDYLNNNNSNNSNTIQPVDISELSRIATNESFFLYPLRNGDTDYYVSFKESDDRTKLQVIYKDVDGFATDETRGIAAAERWEFDLTSVENKWIERALPEVQEAGVYIDQVESIKFAGKDAGLEYSEFGLWKRDVNTHGAVSKSKLGLFNGIVGGLENNQVSYNDGAWESDEGGSVFTGKAIALYEKEDGNKTQTIQELSGNATLTYDAKASDFDFTVDFGTWGQVSGNQTDGLTFTNHPNMTGNFDSFREFGAVSSGADAHTTEIVGIFSGSGETGDIDVDPDTYYSETIKGAYGVKR